MGVPRAARLSQAFLLCSFFFLFLFLFFWHTRPHVWEGFLDRGPGGRCHKTCRPGRGRHCSLTQAKAGSSSSPSQCSNMELWGAYLLLCLSSLLTQVTTEEPTPKVKKAANVKKGKEGDRAPPHLPGSWSPRPLLLFMLLPFIFLLDKSRELS